jgi:hypothetical protein
VGSQKTVWRIGIREGNRKVGDNRHLVRGNPYNPILATYLYQRGELGRVSRVDDGEMLSPVSFAGKQPL